jgi:biopolymer transport protein ExbD
VDGEQFQWEALPRLLEGRDPETRVRISADKQVDYDYIIRAMNAAAEAGLPRIVLETLPGGTT